MMRQEYFELLGVPEMAKVLVDMFAHPLLVQPVATGMDAQPPEGFTVTVTAAQDAQPVLGSVAVA